MSDGLREPLPVLFFFGKLFPALGGQTIVASAAIVFRAAPLCANPAVLFHAVERGIEGTFLNPQDVL